MERRIADRDVLDLRVTLTFALPARERAWVEDRARALGYLSLSAYMRALIKHDGEAERAEREAQAGEGGA